MAILGEAEPQPLQWHGSSGRPLEMVRDKGVISSGVVLALLKQGRGTYRQ
jgi:hypothetical protein